MENVFIESPEAGVWKVGVSLDEFNQTGNTGAAFALVVSAAPMVTSAQGGDWNGDGKIDGSDLTDFLQAFFKGEADVNGDGLTTAGDFFGFLEVFFAGKR